jgi:glutaredoxin 3
MTAPVVVFSKANCPYCVQAKALLELKGVDYTEVRIDLDSTARELMISEGHRTVPQIYQDGKVLVEGGFQGLKKQSDEFFNQLKG